MEKIILVECQVKSCTECKGIYTICISNLYKNIKRNNGIIKCQSCAGFERARGEETYHHLQKNINFFENIDNELKAYLLGVIAGDGSLTKYALHVVAGIPDTETLKLFQLNISPESNINKLKNSNCNYISIPSRKMVNDICNILNIQYGKKCDLITIPNIRKDFISHFIRGLMDTDGSLSNLITSKISFPRCSYASRSIQIKNQIKNICDTLNIKYTQDKVQIVFNGINSIKFLDYIYTGATVFLSRKKALYEIAKTWTPQKGSPFRPRKIRKDMGLKRGPKRLSDVGRQNIIKANKNRKKNNADTLLLP